MYILRRASDGAFYRAPRSPLAHFGTTPDADRATMWTEKRIPERMANRFAEKGMGHWSVTLAPAIGGPVVSAS